MPENVNSFYTIIIDTDLSDTTQYLRKVKRSMCMSSFQSVPALILTAATNTIVFTKNYRLKSYGYKNQNCSITEMDVVASCTLQFVYTGWLQLFHFHFVAISTCQDTCISYSSSCLTFPIHLWAHYSVLYLKSNDRSTVNSRNSGHIMYTRYNGHWT